MTPAIRVVVLAATLAAAPAGLSAQTPVFAESFESGTLNPAVWDVRAAGSATAAVEPVEGAHGTYALHVHYPDMAAASYAFVVATHLPVSVRTHFFGRAFMKISPSVGTSHTPLIFAGEPGWQLSRFHEIGTSRGTWMPSYQENKSPRDQGRGEIVFHTETAPPRNTWFLIEWEFNDDPSAITIWIDGEKISTDAAGGKVDRVAFAWPKGSDNVKNLVGGYQEFGFGARVWGPPAAVTGFDVWYDDIAIGTSRLGPK